jgi:hypothetical protein
VEEDLRSPGRSAPPLSFSCFKVLAGMKLAEFLSVGCWHSLRVAEGGRCETDLGQDDLPSPLGRSAPPHSFLSFIRFLLGTRTIGFLFAGPGCWVWDWSWAWCRPTPLVVGTGCCNLLSYWHMQDTVATMPASAVALCEGSNQQWEGVVGLALNFIVKTFTIELIQNK